MDTTPSYCLDVFVGYHESHREELLQFLKETGGDYDITSVQRGRMNEMKSLRIVTTKAEALERHILSESRTGDDNDYDTYFNDVDARRSMDFMPDYGHQLGDKPFTLDN